MQRASGILLHPTALPSPWPLGDLGCQAYAFVDFLDKAGQAVWQILPLGPTGYGHSPYNTLSAFAGNPALLDLSQLVTWGDLGSGQFESVAKQCENFEFHHAHDVKQTLVKDAARSFFRRCKGNRLDDFHAFCDKNSHWLDDFCLFMSIKDTFSGQAWSTWPVELRTRDPQTVETWRQKLADEYRAYQYQQFVFFDQWTQLKRYANQKGIDIFGDIPFYVAFDSADVWANPGLFQLDEQGRPLAVAGVPPDYFSETGQLWGNPLYQWQEHEATNFKWWTSRFEHQLHNCNLVRVDHFRGFQACWSIPAHATTAIDGHWENVPGQKLFEKLQQCRPELPIIAEDLGYITPEVEQLRDHFGLAGMKVLQFAFDSDNTNPYLPENHVANCSVYTGTHDNDTTLGCWDNLSKTKQQSILGILGINSQDMPWDLIRLAMASTANLCVIPCQDIFGLGSEARFNTPGKATGNWQWQVSNGMLTDQLADKLHALSMKFQRGRHR